MNKIFNREALCYSFLITHDKLRVDQNERSYILLVFLYKCL